MKKDYQYLPKRLVVYYLDSTLKNIFAYYILNLNLNLNLNRLPNTLFTSNTTLLTLVREEISRV
jgi:hypothetical protein